MVRTGANNEINIQANNGQGGFQNPRMQNGPPQRFQNGFQDPQFGPHPNAYRPYPPQNRPPGPPMMGPPGPGFGYPNNMGGPGMGGPGPMRGRPQVWERGPYPMQPPMEFGGFNGLPPERFHNANINFGFNNMGGPGPYMGPMRPMGPPVDQDFSQDNVQQNFHNGAGYNNFRY